MKTQAAVSHPGEDNFSIQDVEIDEPREDEILVRVAGVGLCHTDLFFSSHVPDYPLPAVLGHEGSGIVEKVGSAVTKVAPGDRVAMTFRSCGECDRCASGDAAYCRTMPMLNYAGVRTDGSKSMKFNGEELSGNFFGQSSFSGLALTYERNVVPLPDDVPLELMGPVGCGIQTGAGAVMRSLGCESGSSILILGGGSVGLAAVMGAKIQGCATIIVMEPMAARRELAMELGATHVIDPADDEPMETAVRNIVPLGLDYAFDTTGIPELLQQTMSCLGSKAVFGMVGTCAPGTPMPGDLLSVIGAGQTLKGIIEGDSDPDEFIPELVAHFQAGRLPFDRLIQTYPLSQINEAVADQHAGKCIKAVLLPQ